MTRLLTFVIFLTVLVAIHGDSCSGAKKDLSEVKAENIRYSLEVYYQLLLYIKENNLLDIDNCPRCRCFSDGTCVDLCDGGIWP
ncbi:uncharacterized protein LOC123014812 [Tribolium madens]|uniref:uncharacterized protein LOC123014812 n=1 Tax=Tribolium madens TaxID=41895 RepID=UPI001CF757F6|nr:uncharacterized protein LOC123014812 [Tribolium madens]